MLILKYHDLDNVESFLNNLFIESVMESSEILANTYLSKLKIHKLILDEYSDIIPKLNLITKDLIKNSNLNIEVNDFNLTLFSLASLSNCILDNASFLIKHNIVKNEYVMELKSILEELKLNGIGNELVKMLSSFYVVIIHMSSEIFKEKEIHDLLKPNNLLQVIDNYINKNKLSFDTFINSFKKLSKLISVYVKSGKLDILKNKLSQKIDQGVTKVLSVNEFNL